jgi:hypothetical protein
MIYTRDGPLTRKSWPIAYLQGFGARIDGERIPSQLVSSNLTGNFADSPFVVPRLPNITNMTMTQS